MSISGIQNASALYSAYYTQSTDQQTTSTGKSSSKTEDTVTISEAAKEAARLSESILATSDTDSAEVKTSADNFLPQFVKFDGITVQISGHSLDAREGVSLLHVISATNSTDIFKQLASFQEAGNQSGDEQTNSTMEVECDASMTVLESKALGPLPAGATSPYMDIDMFRPAGKWNEDPMSRSTIDSNDSFYRKQTEQLMKVVETERQLKISYGNDVKLIYSHADDNYIMLTPDDARYNDMHSAESSVQSLINDVNAGYINKDAVSDILNEHGFKL